PRSWIRGRRRCGSAEGFPRGPREAAGSAEAEGFLRAGAPPSQPAGAGGAAEAEAGGLARVPVLARVRVPAPAPAPLRPPRSPPARWAVEAGAPGRGRRGGRARSESPARRGGQGSARDRRGAVWGRRSLFLDVDREFVETLGLHQIDDL